MPASNFLKGLFSSKEQSVIGVDIGSASIKVVQLRRQKGRAILETYGELSLGPYAGIEIGRSTRLSPDKIVEALKDVMKEANITTNDSALSISMKSSMVSVIKMPQMEERQLAQMVPIEARKYIPVPISEITLDWFKIPQSDEEEYFEATPTGTKVKQTEVLVVAIHNDILTNMSAIVKNAGLQTSFFEIEMFSTIRAVLEHGDNTPVMIVDIGAGATKAYVVERGIVRDSHIINKGSQEITINISQSLGVAIDFAERLKRNFGRNEAGQDEKIAKIIDLVNTPILSEVNTVLLNYQRRYNKDIAKVVLTGGGALLNGIIETANKKLSIPVVPGDPFSKVAAPAFLQEVLKKSGLAFAPAIGLALRKLQDLS